MTSTFLDIIILALIFTSGLFGVIYGLIDIVISTFGFFCSLIAAFLIFPYVEDILVDYVHNEILLSIATGLASYLLSILFFGIIKSILRKLTKPISGGWIDKLLGSVFGLLRGLILASIFMLLLISISPTKPVGRDIVKNMEFTENDKPKWLFDSYSFTYFSFSFKELNNYFPTFYDDICDAIIKQLDIIKNNPKLKNSQKSGESDQVEDQDENKSDEKEDDLDNSLKSFFKEQKNGVKKI
jgi:membrane protein required for colicin V production